MSQDDKRSKVGYWLKWISAAKKAANKQHWPDSRAAYAEYEMKGVRGDDSVENSTILKRSYPIYWASSEIIYASYYARTPVVKCSRLYGIEDEMALTMCLINDRLGQFLVRHGFFDDAMTAAVGDIVHASKATTQVIYTTQTKMQREPLAMQQEAEQEPQYYFKGEKTPYADEVEEENGVYYGQRKVVIEETQKIMLAPVLFDEVLHTPGAKTPADITDIAYKFSIEKEEAEEKFNTNSDGSSKGLSLPYKTSKEYGEENRYDDDVSDESPGRCLEGWEIHCLTTRSVYWVCEDFKDAVLLVEPDPWGLEKFFPSPAFRITNKHRKSLYPTPTFVYLEATINQLHALYYRIFRLIDGIRRRALVLTDSPEIIKALNKLDGEEFVQAGAIADMLLKGDLKELIQYVDVKELVDALSEAMNIEDHFKNLFFEWFGVPEVMRGNSDPEKTAEAVSIESESAVNRFKFIKRQIVDLARDSAEMMVDLALKVFSDEKIAKICGYNYLAPGDPGTPPGPPDEKNPQGTPATPPKPGHKERFFEVLARLRNDDERIVRLDFETDATSFRDEQRELERQQMISNTILQGLATIGGIQHPEFMRIALQMLLSVVNAMGGSTQSEDLIRQAVQDLEKTKNAPPAPPPPDYESMKIQIASAKIRQQANSDQIDAQAKSREADIKQMQAMLDQQAQVFEERLAAARLQLDQQKEASSTQLKAFEMMLEKALVAIEQEKLDLERYKTEAQQMLSGVEEIRLAKEASTEALARVTDFLQANQEKLAQASMPQALPAPNLTIVNDIKAQHAGMNFIRDAEGRLLRAEPDKTQ